ncbi:tetratricopeptide repeat protein [Acidocella sp.]|uniref:tetratricopeptide repeat protein n=1 Tax=Acidocella sp. TaxID=50710 RepID=UPI003D028B77
MVDILDEIAEDIRHERALKLAKRYGGLLVLVLILILAGVAGQEYWQAHKTKQAEAAATRYLALTQQVDEPNGDITPAQAETTAKTLITFSDTAPETYKTLARLRAAALYANAGETSKAAALWTRIGADEAAPTLLRDAANLLFAQHELGIAKDSDILARLQPMVQARNSYHGLAREMQAMAYLNEGNTAMAKSFFTQVQDDPSAPQGARNRAQAMLAKLNG